MIPHLFDNHSLFIYSVSFYEFIPVDYGHCKILMQKWTIRFSNLEKYLNSTFISI